MVGWDRLTRSGSPEHSVPLRLWTLGAVVVGVFAVTAHNDFWQYRLTVPILIVAGFAFSHWRRGKPNWWVKIALALLCLRVGWQFLRAVAADPYHTSIPLTVLLLWLQTLHAFDVPARRDLLFSLLSSVILMAVAAAFSEDPTYLVFLAIYAAAAVQALMHNARRGVQEAAAAPPIAAVAPIERPPLLGSWRARVLDANHFLVVVLLVAAVVFVLTPRFGGMRLTALPFSPQAMLLDLFAGRVFNPAYPGGVADAGRLSGWNPRGYFGFSPTIDLRLRGRLDDRIVMRVRATHLFNWRALVFDTYTGTGWEIADRRTTAVEGAPPITLIYDKDEVFSYAARSLQVTQTFHIEEEQPNVVFAAPLVEQLYVPTGRVHRDRYGSLRLPGTLKPGMVYSVVSRAFVPEPARLRAAAGLTPAFIRERYLGLPPLPVRVGALARGIVASEPTTYDRVLAINRYLWTHYRYDLTIPPQRRPGDAVDYFLFEERRGYCEQFASAMVVLLRSVGIPARLVTGYTPGTPNPVTGLLEVRNSDAHAWVEAFFPGIGWVEFEPTPGFADTADLGGPALGLWVWRDLGLWLHGRLSGLALRFPVLGHIASALAGTGRPAMWGAAALAVVIAAVRTRRMLARRASPAPASALFEIYAQMCRVLARRGISRRPSDTIMEYLRRVEGSRGLPEVNALSAVVEAVAYGGLEPDASTLQAARGQLRALRERLRGSGGIGR